MFNNYTGVASDIIGASGRDRSIAAAERYELEQALREVDRITRAERRAQRKASRSAARGTRTTDGDANVRRLVPTPFHW